MSLRCPQCFSQFSKVTHTYTNTVSYKGRTKTVVLRRRKCKHCGTAYKAVETLEEDIIQDAVDPILDLIDQQKEVNPYVPPPPKPDNPFIPER